MVRRLVRGYLRHRASRTLGQSFVEFALTLPILLLIVLGTVDLGRAYFAGITIENAVKEGAFYGARHPECATNSGGDCADPDNVQARVSAEADGITMSTFQAKCFAPGTTVFTGSGKALADCEDGDLYYVHVQTPFSLITPLISNLVGSTITMGSTATSVVLTSFDVATGSPIPIPTTTASATPVPGTCTVPNFSLGPTKIGGAQNVWVNIAGFVAANLTTNGPNGHDIVWQSVPAGTVAPCATQTITVSSTVMATPTPTPVPTPVPTPTPAPSATPTPSGTATPTPAPTPTPVAMCTVPDMKNDRVTVAQGKWSAAGFQAANFTAVRPPNDDYKVKTQSIAKNSSRPCLTTAITVDD